MAEQYMAPLLRIVEGYSNSLEICRRDGTFFLDVENESAGDTETGFGRTCHVSLSIAQAELLHDWLSVQLDRMLTSSES